MTPRVTVRDIAKRAGVHFTSVSMALRNHPRISEGTRANIKKIAKEMGYRPDAMLSALSSYRQLTRKPHYQATLAWFNAHPKRESLYKTPLYHEYYSGARERAEELGFKIEEFWLGEPGLTKARLSSILHARGIRGGLVAPLPPSEFETIEFIPWAKLSAVSLTFSLQHLRLHTVAPNQYHSMQTILHELRKLGYRRIGFASTRKFDTTNRNHWQAAFWVDYHSQPPEHRVEPLWLPPGPIPAAEFQHWVKTQRPDVITPHVWQMEDLLQKMGMQVPRDIGLVMHNVVPGERHFAGIDERGTLIGSAALEHLIAMLNHQEYGIPKTPKHLLIEGRWVNGKTVRRVGPSLISKTKE